MHGECTPLRHRTGALRGPLVAGDRVSIPSARGLVTAFRHGPHDAPGAVLMVGGVGNDVEGPAGTYIDLAERLADHGLAGLRVSYRRTGIHDECVHDVQAAVAAAAEQGAQRVVLLGWSFGGAVVIAAGARRDTVVGVATFATQSYDAGEARFLAPRPLLLIHGTDDRILPPSCSHTVFGMAAEPKDIVLYPGETHTLDRFGTRFVDDILRWVLPLLTTPRFAPSESG